MGYYSQSVPSARVLALFGALRVLEDGRARCSREIRERSVLVDADEDASEEEDKRRSSATVGVGSSFLAGRKSGGAA